MKRNIFTFDEDDFHIALMHNYKQGKICIFALNEQDVISGNKKVLSENRHFIISDKNSTDNSNIDRKDVLVITSSKDLSYIYRGISQQFPNARVTIMKKPQCKLRFSRII